MTTLLESKARPYGSKKGAALSIALHGALIAGAVVASGTAMLPERETVEEHSVLFVAPPPPKVHVAPEPVPEPKKPPPAKAPVAPRQVAPPPPRQAPAQPQRAAPPTVIAPTSVPVSLPPINLKATPTVDVDIRVAPPDIPKSASGSSGLVKTSSGGDVEGGSGSGRSLGSGASNKAYRESQVDRAVQQTRAAQPRYPDALRSVNVTGEVVASYIVDARGRVEPGSIKIISASHPLFGSAVRAALLEARFRPAEVAGQPVRQLVEQPFIFKLDG